MRQVLTTLNAANPKTGPSYYNQNVITPGYGFALRPYFDTHIASNNSNPTGNYKFNCTTCPIPPAPGPFLVHVFFADEQRDLLVLDDRPHYFPKQFRKVDIEMIGSASAGTPNAPAILNNGTNSIPVALLATIFETPDEWMGYSPEKMLGTIALFNADNEGIMCPPSSVGGVRTSFPDSSSPPTVKSPINCFGLSDNSSEIVTGVVIVGAFYVFPQMKRWRIALSAQPGQTAAIDIWTCPGQGLNLNSGQKDNGFQLNETIPVGQWNANNTLVLERECSFVNEWVQIAAQIAPASSNIIITQAHACVEY